MNKGERLKLSRLKAGYKSAVSFAKKIGADPAVYRSHERGDRSFSLDDAIKYSKVLNISYNWLVTGEGMQELSAPSFEHHKPQQESNSKKQGSLIVKCTLIARDFLSEKSNITPNDDEITELAIDMAEVAEAAHTSHISVELAEWLYTARNLQ